MDLGPPPLPVLLLVVAVLGDRGAIHAPAVAAGDAFPTETPRTSKRRKMVVVLAPIKVWRRTIDRDDDDGGDGDDENPFATTLVG